MDPITSVAPASPRPVPEIRPDLRPAADAAALRRDPTPEAPLGVLPGLAPLPRSAVAAVSRSLLAASVTGNGAVRPPVAVLKPYGVTILPAEPGQDRAGAETPADEKGVPRDTIGTD